MQIRCKIPNIFAVYILLLLLNFVWGNTITIGNVITNVLNTMAVFFVAGWFRGNSTSLLEPFMHIGKYIIFITMGITMAIFAFVLQLCPMTLIQYTGFMVTTIAVYYFTDSAFVDDEL